MYLHEDKVSFMKLLRDIHDATNLPASIIEKDYYVFMLLKYIVSKLGDEVVFKGGTSLSKAYYIINRFSEDIDLCLPYDKMKSGGARKRVVESVFEGFDTFGLVNSTTRQVQRHGDYNDIRGSYDAVSVDNVVEPYIKVETAHRIKEYPYDRRIISSYMGDYIKRMTGNYGSFGLESFYVTTVSVYRTFIDKLYAIADYYMNGKVKRYSRHLYDVYKICCSIDWVNVGLIFQLQSLLKDVGLERAWKRGCLSASAGVVLKDKLYEAMVSDYYMEDYNTITLKVLYENVSYDLCKSTILQLLGTQLFA